jgi:hypothetical protein
MTATAAARSRTGAAASADTRPIDIFIGHVLRTYRAPLTGAMT